MKKTLLVLAFILQDSLCFADLPINNQPPLNTTLSSASSTPHKGLIGDLQTTLNNLPQTISSMLPTVSNIQKLFLTAAIIGLGYQSCTYGLSKCNTATKLHSKSDDSEKGKRKYRQSTWYALAGGSFFLAGTCMLLCAQRIANFAYGQ